MDAGWNQIQRHMKREVQHRVHHLALWVVTGLVEADLKEFNRKCVVRSDMLLVLTLRACLGSRVRSVMGEP